LKGLLVFQPGISSRPMNI